MINRKKRLLDIPFIMESNEFPFYWLLITSPLMADWRDTVPVSVCPLAHPRFSQACGHSLLVA